MTTKKKKGSVKRFGVRYGATVKEKLQEVESEQKKKQYCILCDKTVKRVAKGLFYCKSCKRRFTGQAYYVKKKI